jgi:nicotinamide-nucleotide amidase
MQTEEILANIKEHLLRQDETLAVAESVTSGHLQATLSLAQDAMKFFQGGITAYNLGQKARHLWVEPVHALSCNCVSEKVATQMALGASKLFGSQWGIGVTGYAAPDPEHDIEELFAYYAFSHNRRIVHAERINCEKRGIAEVQKFYTQYVLESLTHQFQLMNDLVTDN